MEIHEGACMFVYHVVLQQVHCKSSFIVHHEEIQRSLHQCFPTFPCRPRGVTISATISLTIISTATMHGHNCHCSVIQHHESLLICANGM